MKSIDALGDADGQVEVSDVIKAVSDYISDIGDIILKNLDSIDIFDIF